MSQRTWTNVGIAVVGAALAYFTFGASMILTGAALGYAVGGLIQGPESPKSGSMRPDEFQMVQSSESATVPVAFGTTRLAGNFLEWKRQNFEAVPQYQEAEGGKGGGSEKTQSGFQYFMTFDIGLCMGRVDYLVGIQGSPGMDRIKFHATTEADKPLKPTSIDRDKMVAWLKNFKEQQAAATSGPIDVSGGEVEVTMKGKNDDGGKIIFYPGTPDQSKYRYVAAVRFVEFCLGGSPVPRSYLFCVQRMPEALDADRNIISGFPVNASVDPDDAEFGDANPAAVLWEVLTNDIWGKGSSPELLNVDDFKRAAVYFQAKRMGVSTSVGDDASNVQLAERFSQLFGLVTWWQNGQLRCRCLWDRANAYTFRRRITPEDIIGEALVARASMSSSTNEVRMTFTNRENNWQSEAVTCQDLASIESIGGVRSVKIDAAEVGTRRTAEIIGHRILRMMAYPMATCQIKVRRNFSDLVPGEFVELVTDGWRGDAMTTYWRVDSITDDQTGDDIFSVNMIEDIYATGIDGVTDEFDVPDNYMDDDDPLTNGDVVTEDNTIPSETGIITPTLVMEPNIFVSRNQRRLFAAIQRRSGMVQSFGVGFREQAVGNFIDAGVFLSLAITGTLLDDVPIGPKIIRKRGHFRITLTVPDNATDLLSAASSVQDDSDGLDMLTATNQALMVIGDEIFRCGFIEETGANEFTVRVAIRGEYATDKEAHLAGDTFHFIQLFDANSMTRRTDRLPINLPTDVAFNPFTVNGSAEPTFETHEFAGESIQPLRPELVRATRVGLTWTLILRPRIYNGGSGFGPSVEEELQAREGDVGNHRIRLKRTGGDAITLANYFTTGTVGPSTIQAQSFTFTPTDGTSPDTGVWTVVVTFDTNPASLVVYEVLAGRTSKPLTIQLP